MSMTQEIVARIGADTSGFKKGVDDVAVQSARLKNDMRITFEAGSAGAKSLRGAIKGVADIAGQTQGPIGHFVSGIQSLFNAFKAHPILGVATTISAAVALISKQVSDSTEEALKKTQEIVAAVRNARNILKTIAPEKYDLVFKAQENAAKMVESRDTSGANEQIIALEKMRAEQAALAEKYANDLVDLPPKIKKLEEEKKNALLLSNLPGGGGQLEKAAAIQKIIDPLSRDLQVATEMSGEGPAAKQFKQNAEDISRQIAIYKKVLEDITELKKEEKKAAEAFDAKAAKDTDERNKKAVQEGELQDRLMAQRKELQREQEIAKLELQGKDTGELRKRFITEDLAALKPNLKSSDLTARLEAQTRQLQLQNELIDIEREKRGKQKSDLEKTRRGQDDLKQSSRDLALTREQVAGRNPDLLRRQFIQSDLREAQKALRVAPINERSSARAKIEQLTEELLRVNKDIRDKTGKGSRA